MSQDILAGFFLNKSPKFFPLVIKTKIHIQLVQSLLCCAANNQGDSLALSSIKKHLL